MAKSLPQRMVENTIMSFFREFTRPGIKKAKETAVAVYDKLVNPAPEKVVKHDTDQDDE